MRSLQTAAALVSGKNIDVGGEYSMDRLQTDFENAWRSSCKAVEGIALLLLSILIVGLQGCLKGVTSMHQWIEQSGSWLVPGKNTTWQLDTKPDNKESGLRPVRTGTATP